MAFDILMTSRTTPGKIGRFEKRAIRGYKSIVNWQKVNDD